MQASASATEPSWEECVKNAKALARSRKLEVFARLASAVVAGSHTALSLRANSKRKDHMVKMAKETTGVVDDEMLVFVPGMLELQQVASQSLRWADELETYVFCLPLDDDTFTAAEAERAATFIALFGKGVTDASVPKKKDEDAEPASLAREDEQDEDSTGSPPLTQHEQRAYREMMAAKKRATKK